MLTKRLSDPDMRPGRPIVDEFGEECVKIEKAEAIADAHPPHQLARYLG
jgi:hypothetical protein